MDKVIAPANLETAHFFKNLIHHLKDQRPCTLTLSGRPCGDHTVVVMDTADTTPVQVEVEEEIPTKGLPKTRSCFSFGLIIRYMHTRYRSGEYVEEEPELSDIEKELTLIGRMVLPLSEHVPGRIVFTARDTI